MRSGHRFEMVVACLALGCRSDAAPPPPVAAPQAPELRPPPAVPSTLPGIDEAALRGLVDSWLSAQNDGDFARYQALYAERFEGIKRVGDRVQRYDRAGWLADRRRMFTPPKSGAAMRVGIGALVVQSGSTAARVRFDQSYSRGTFSDRGPKELLVVREKGELRIAREELLSSRVEPPAPAQSATARGAFHFVIARGVVLDESPSAQLRTGELELLPPEGSVVVVRSAVNEAALDPALARARSRPVLLNGSPECRARIGALSLVVRVDPHFATRRAWSGIVEVDGELRESGEVATDAAIAREVWELGSPVLVGELVGAPEGCHPVWVRDASLPAVTSVAPNEVMGGKLREEAERQMLSAIARFAPPEPGVVPELTLLRFGGQHPLWVGRYARGSGCSDSLTATFVWRVTGGTNAERLELANDPERTMDFVPELALDLDGDGRWELLGNQASTLLEPASSYESGPAIGITALDCPC